MKLKKNGSMETVLECVITYIHDRDDLNSISLVSRKFYELDSLTRKHLTVHAHYAPNPSRVTHRFPFIESLTLKGFRPDLDFTHISDIDNTHWNELISDVSGSFPFIDPLALKVLPDWDFPKISDIETFHFGYRTDRYDSDTYDPKYVAILAKKDITLLAKKCSNSLISLKISPKPLNYIGDAIRHAIKLE
ncbi:hypothetical protein Tco_0102313, partial [Tanacetum coccineum]